MVAVTGASGHVGGNLVRALLGQGRRVRALIHRDRRALEGLDVELAFGDLQDLESLKRAFQGAEVVYHSAAYISILMSEWSSLEAINVVGTRNVVEACIHCGVRRLVHFSSIHSHEQEPLELPLDESRLLVGSRRHPPYDRSKAAGELEVMKGIERGLDAVILNPTGIIGPCDFRPSHIGDVLLMMGRGRLPAPVQGGFDWVDVRDVVEGALAAEQRSPTGAKYLLSGHWRSVEEMAASVEQNTGITASRIGFSLPLWLAHLGAPFVTSYARLRDRRPLYTRMSLKTLRSNRRVSHERATRELGFHPRPFTQTITDTLGWFVENGDLDGPSLGEPIQSLEF